MDWIRLWQKAKTPRSDASDVQYSFILMQREEENRGFLRCEELYGV